MENVLTVVLILVAFLGVLWLICFLAVSLNDLVRKATRVAFGEWTSPVFMAIGSTVMGCVGIWLIKVGMNSELVGVAIIGLLVSIIGFGVAFLALKNS